MRSLDLRIKHEPSSKGYLSASKEGPKRKALFKCVERIFDRLCNHSCF